MRSVATHQSNSLHQPTLSTSNVNFLIYQRPESPTLAVSSRWSLTRSPATLREILGSANFCGTKNHTWYTTFIWRWCHCNWIISINFEISCWNNLINFNLPQPQQDSPPLIFRCNISSLNTALAYSVQCYWLFRRFYPPDFVLSKQCYCYTSLL